jgi:hypothetical protein
MPDICELILTQHHEMRQRFAELDAFRADQRPDLARLSERWDDLHRLLDAHAEAEEILFYPLLLDAAGDDEAADETQDAISDHNDIRDAGNAAARFPVGSTQWWSVVLQAREHNSTHMAEEERGALSDARISSAAQGRADAGVRWQAFMTGRTGELAAASHDKDPDHYVETHSRSGA